MTNRISRKLINSYLLRNVNYYYDFIEKIIKFYRNKLNISVLIIVSIYFNRRVYFCWHVRSSCAIKRACNNLEILTSSYGSERQL